MSGRTKKFNCKNHLSHFMQESLKNCGAFWQLWRRVINIVIFEVLLMRIRNISRIYPVRIRLGTIFYFWEKGKERAEKYLPSFSIFNVDERRKRGRTRHISMLILFSLNHIQRVSQFLFIGDQNVSWIHFRGFHSKRNDDRGFLLWHFGRKFETQVKRF